MTTNSIQRLVRMSAVSTFIALMALSFLAFGSVSAHTISQAQAGSAGAKATIVRMKNDQFGRAIFAPGTVTVKSGTPVKIVNKSPNTRLLFYSQGIIVLAPGMSLVIVATQSQSVRICAGGTLTITIV